MGWNDLNGFLFMNDLIKKKEVCGGMEQIICPIDGKPCEETCPDRYIDRAEGGCFMTTFIEVCGPDSVIIMRSKGGGKHGKAFAPRS